MPIPEAQLGRAETVLGAVLYLMTAYRRTQCPRIAACVAAHLECLAGHPQVDATIRDLCAGMCDEWRSAAQSPRLRPDLH
jgi:hypothetical protein